MFRFLLVCVLGTVVTVLGQRPNVLVTRSPASIRQGIANNPSAFNSNSYNLTFVISVENLPNTDILDNIDPYIKVYQTNKTHAEPDKIGTTETIKDSPTAEFITVISYLWKKGQGQKWVLRVKDSDNLHDKTVAEGIIDVDEYVANGERMNVTLKDSEGKAVSGSILVQKTTPIKFKLYARNLPRLDIGNGKSDPYVKCYWRRGPNGDEVKFYETQVENNVENVDWNETIEFANYIKGSDLWWVFKVRDSDTTGDDEIGDALVEIDPFVEKRQTKPVRLGKTGEATLFVTPA